jgi:hypothetical protein
LEFPHGKPHLKELPIEVVRERIELLRAFDLEPETMERRLERLVVFEVRERAKNGFDELERPPDDDDEFCRCPLGVQGVERTMKQQLAGFEE